ncbi:MAG: hypothetical protein CMF22_10275 [Idiomarinaceae bacterium]|nr:hypothetical protein [Idiomarinaceae bacterium]MBG23828.1 hypothetical protein [Idiomarinaceae bacterium]|tara:strand:- start:33156 stop:33389 length:234 start_codon:yes stop_codon:yes gene_type:complete
MKYYKFIYPDEQGLLVEEVLSEQDILDFYWEYWYEKMVRKGLRDKISIHHCIDDFVVVNWAWEVDVDDYTDEREKIK